MTNATSSQAVTGPRDEDQPKFPWRAGIGLLLGAWGWFFAGQAVNTVLLPAKIAQIDPAGKVGLVAIVSTVTMLISVVAGVVGGALSDLTRSKIGARSPWIIGGVIVGTVLLIIFTVTDSVAVVLVTWWLYAAVYNVMLAAGLAWQPDMIAKRWRGTTSSMYGIGHQIALQGSQVVIAPLVTNIPKGVIIALVVTDIVSLLSVLVAKEPSNLGVPRQKTNIGQTFRNFLPPLDGGRDYYLAALARFLWMMPGGIGTYRLYTLTDYMHQSEGDAGNWMSIMALLGMVISIVFCVISGPLADRLHTIKAPLAVAIFAVGLPCWLPFFLPTPMHYTIYVAISAIGGGIFTSLDQAIMTTVLPHPENAAKDLAFLNSCGVIGNLAAPLLAAWVISEFGYRGLFPMGFIVLTAAAICVFFIKKVR